MAANFFLNFRMLTFKEFDSPEYISDKPWDIGLGLRYKNIFASFSLPAPFIKQPKRLGYDIEISSYFERAYFEAYSKRYPNLIEQDSNEYSDVDVDSSGIIVIFLQNSENHSLGSAIKLNKKQNQSSGSLLYGFGIFHSSLYSTNGTIEKFSDKQNLLYFGPGLGYSYLWTFKNCAFLNISLLSFMNPGININTDRWLFIPQLQPRIVIGHHNDTWSANLTMMNNAKFIIWNKDEIDSLTLISISIMFSKRF